MTKMYKYTRQDIESDLNKIKLYEQVMYFGSREERKRMNELYKTYSTAVANGGMYLFTKFFLFFPMNLSFETVGPAFDWTIEEMTNMVNYVKDFLFKELNKEKESVA